VQYGKYADKYGYDKYGKYDDKVSSERQDVCLIN
jgi:hypothetical protein